MIPAIFNLEFNILFAWAAWFNEVMLKPETDTNSFAYYYVGNANQTRFIILDVDSIDAMGATTPEAITISSTYRPKIRVENGVWIITFAQP